MDNQNIEQTLDLDSKAHFDTLEMKEILDFIEKENNKALSADRIDQIADAWSKVERKKLFRN